MSKDTGVRHIIYKTTNLVNGKYYIGVHVTEDLGKFDGYLGSGVAIKAAVRKYGAENFSRETLFSYVSRIEADNKEKELVTLDFVKQKTNYNICLGGSGGNYGEYNGFYGKTHSTFSKALIGASSRCRVCTPQARKNRSKAVFGENNPMFGHTQKIESKIKMSRIKLPLTVLQQRVTDIWLIDKTKDGWKSYLAQKWGVSNATVSNCLQQNFGKTFLGRTYKK